MCAALYAMRKRCTGMIETFGGDSMLRVESTLLSMLELIDIEKTYPYQLVVPRPCWHAPHVRKAMSISTPADARVYFRTPYIAGVKARTCFLSIGLVMASATFMVVLM